MLVLIAWLLAFILSLPIGVLYHVRKVQNRPQCWIEFPEQWHWQLYMTLVATALFVAPAFIISICYALIVTTIWAKSTFFTHSEYTQGV